MNKKLLKSGIEDFISNNLNTDIVSVLLKKSPFPKITPKELAQQLQGAQIAQNKLPSWFKTTGILYPKKLHLEQSSSEVTALYKSQIVRGKTLLDMTGGFGVDATAFASEIECVFYCETNEELAQITSHNFEQMKVQNVHCHIGDGVDFLASHNSTFDWIYLDPSRRSGSKKLISLDTYEPNILELIKDLFTKSSNILLKTSPLLDLKLGLKQLQNVAEVHVVAVRNEVKELLWVLGKNVQTETSITAVNICDSVDYKLTYTLSEEQMATPYYGDPQAYLYEPNAAILNAGAFGLVGLKHGVQKLSKHSHLYTSKEKVDFPGRSFQIVETLHFSNKWNSDKTINKANITTRNFPLSVKEIRNRFKIKEGGEEYLFFTTLESGEKQIIKCIRC